MTAFYFIGTNLYILSNLFCLLYNYIVFEWVVCTQMISNLWKSYAAVSQLKNLPDNDPSERSAELTGWKRVGRMKDRRFLYSKALWHDGLQIVWCPVTESLSRTLNVLECTLHICMLHIWQSAETKCIISPCQHYLFAEVSANSAGSTSTVHNIKQQYKLKIPYRN